MYFNGTIFTEQSLAKQGNHSWPVCISIDNTCHAFSRHPSKNKKTSLNSPSYYQKKRQIISRYQQHLFNKSIVPQKENLLEKLHKMQEVDIRSVDPEDLVDMKDVKIRMNLPAEDRVRDFIHQIKNPYCYRSHGVAVKISFAGKQKLEDCLMSCIAMECGGSPHESTGMERRNAG